VFFKARGLPVVAAGVGAALMAGGQIAAVPTPNLILMSRSFLPRSQLIIMFVEAGFKLYTFV